MVQNFKYQLRSLEPWATTLSRPTFMRIQTSGYCSSEVEMLPCWVHGTSSSLNYICQGQLFHRNGIRVITMFEQQDSGKWESWSAAHGCNWSPGIFTHCLINMPLKQSRHICQRNKDAADNDDQKFWNFCQLLRDKVFECLGHRPLMWIDRITQSL